LIVGDSSTHGKGTVQSLLQLAPYMRQKGVAATSNPGAVKITIRKFYRASGSSTQLKGVVPDLVLPSVNNYAEVGEGSLENPLPWDTIASAGYEKMNRVEPFLSELKRRSEARTTAERDWVYVRDDIDRFKKILAEKSVSMNEAERLKEKKDNDDRVKARKKELASRAKPNEKVYDITLKLAIEPGLPPATVKTNHVAEADTKVAPGHAGTGQLVRVDSPKAEKDSSDKTIKTGDDSDESLDDKVPNLDIPLEEAKRILADYVVLAAKQNGLAATGETK